MKLVDANVLVYASNAEAPHHAESRSWLTDAVNGHETVLVPWLVVVAYLRLSTHPKLSASPNSVAESLSFIRAVLDAPVVEAGKPDDRHLERVADLLTATGRGGNLVSDAHLGALALQYDATVISYDNDFDRFPGVRWERPTAPDHPAASEV